MERSMVMNGGEGPKSSFENSKLQILELLLDGAKVLLVNGIEESLEIQKQSKVFSMADLGCSTGPNTFSCVKTIIQAVQHKYKTQVPDEGEIPEFHVFFNDQVGNDFNTLFKALPSARQYMAAGVPGSFYGRLFPKSSMNLIHSSTSLHWLQRFPEKVTEKDSPSWNKGRITYAKSSIQVVDAFRDQFFNDMNDFLKARSQELAPGGLLPILTICRPEGTLPSEAIPAYIFECLGDSLADVVKEGIIDEDLVDSFNIPIFIPTASEVKEVVASSDKHLSIARLQEVHYPPSYRTPEQMQILSAHFRALLEGIVREHLGPKLTDELFDRLPQKLESFIKTPRFTRVKKLENLFLLVKRRDGSQITNAKQEFQLALSISVLHVQ